MKVPILLLLNFILSKLKNLRVRKEYNDLTTQEKIDLFEGIELIARNGELKNLTSIQNGLGSSRSRTRLVSSCYGPRVRPCL